MRRRDPTRRQPRRRFFFLSENRADASRRAGAPTVFFSPRGASSRRVASSFVACSSWNTARIAEERRRRFLLTDRPSLVSYRRRPTPRRSCASASWRLTGGRSWWTRRWRRSGTTTCRFGWTRPSRRRRGRSRSALNPNDSARRGERIDRRRIDRSRLEPRATGPDRLARLMIQTTLHDVSLRYSSSSPAEKTRQPGSEKVFPSRLACLRYIWYRRYRGETLVSFIKVAHESRGPSFSDASGTTDGIFSTWGSARLRSARTRP